MSMKQQKKKKGQSTLEYIILVTAVIAILLTFLQKDGLFQTAVQDTMQQGTNGMDDMANRLRYSRPKG